MTDNMKAKELHELADALEQRLLLSGSGAIKVEEYRVHDIASALRLAATLEDFGEIGADKTPTLRKMPFGWLASISAPAAHGNIEETPIEAMRAAIDAAKPKPHVHDFVWQLNPERGLPYRKRYKGLCECGDEQFADHLVPAKEDE